MKYDLSKKPTKGAQRTLKAFSVTMLQLVSEFPFEEVNVNQICQASNYPRATFYNYFNDKYDLLEYCWYLLGQQIDLSQHTHFASDQLLFIYFDRIYSFLFNQRPWLEKTVANNAINGSLVLSFIDYLKKQTREIFYTQIESEVTDQTLSLPLELLADHYSNTLLLVLEWIFFKQNPTDKETSHYYLRQLLGRQSFQF